ncbi:nucleotide-diphospho-sugar transferases [Lucifera butyrica]|uniref:Nucleotide-diphospho-sugar transferases n=1 Tax=Lucifera butyrica TaxID=1351585 RepID=A0A498RE83_9FIRM|nr:glycosyltransferase family 2 protein [Lucifera butyrica]VBB09305.1 nucleotide-diphospho-sugar transferases [Lucifera butyrica]
MSRLAVLILTYNEEHHIAGCIQSASFADEIVVVDSGSSDRTVALAEAHEAKVVQHPMTEGFAAQRNFALTCTDADWVLYLDADERITPELAAEIQKAVSSGAAACYSIKRYSIAFGQKMKYGVCRPDTVVRLFPLDAAEWEGMVHEGIKSNLPRRQLPSYMEHYTYTSWDRYFQKFNQYTTLWAEASYKKGKRCTQASIIGHAAGSFLQMGILKRGFFDGFYGFVLCCFHFSYTLAKYIKLYELQKRGAKSRADCNP